MSFRQIDEQAALRRPSDVLFLPYIVGTNAPEFDLDACGMFYGLRSKHDAFDLALAVMEGVAHLLKKNCDRILASGTPIERIIATGGGAKSALCVPVASRYYRHPVSIPAEKEAACLGAAMIGAVGAGVYADVSEAANAVVRLEATFVPQADERNERKHRQFVALYEAMIAVQRMQ